MVVSAVAAAVAAPRVLRGPAPERSAAAGASAPRATPGPATGRRVFGPGAALAAVVALIYLNQLLFAVYVLRVHGGDTSFVARYLPPGWFATADGGLVRRLAAHMPAPDLLAPSVLRVQAFLELPFVLLAFATVLRRLDAGLYRREESGPPARPPTRRRSAWSSGICATRTRWTTPPCGCSPPWSPRC